MAYKGSKVVGRVGAIINHKNNETWDENKIFPAVELSNLRQDLIQRARKLATIREPNHSWNEMDDMEMLKTTSLYAKNLTTGEEGFTLASILLFGTGLYDWVSYKNYNNNKIQW